MFRVTEVPPLEYDGNPLIDSLQEFDIIFVSPKDVKSLFSSLDSMYPIPSHLKRVRKGSGGMLEVLLGHSGNLDPAIDIRIMGYERGKVTVPLGRPLRKEDFDAWTGWPIKWYQPPYRPTKLNYSEDTLAFIATQLRRFQYDEIGCCAMSCLLMSDSVNQPQIYAHNVESSSCAPSVSSNRMLPIIANHPVMSALRMLAAEVRSSEQVARTRDLSELETLPSNRQRIYRSSGANRNMIIKKLKGIEGDAISRNVCADDEELRVPASQYYATGLTAAVMGKNICLMCAMALVHSRIRRLLIFETGEESGGFNWFTSKYIRMHTDGDRLNHTFGLYVISESQPKKQEVT